VTVALFVVSTLALVAMDAAPNARAVAKQAERVERLDAEREIDGVACMTRVSYHPDGRLRSCVLARDTVFPSGLELPTGTQVGFDDQGVPERAFLPANMVLDGHHCIGTGTHDAMTTFHPNGRLRFCNLADVELINGLPCQRSSFWIWITQGGAGTYFHDNGALQSCLLAADVTVGGQVFRKRDHLRLDRDGTPLK
jgi:hypothetical protein